jgi:hypothetical protein
MCKEDFHNSSCARLCRRCVGLAAIAAKFGLTLRNYCYLYYEIFQEKCGICSRGETYLSRQKRTIRLSLDHVHLAEDDDPKLAAVRGAIRGILCSRCNWDVEVSDLLSNRAHYISANGHGPERYAKVLIFNSFQTDHQVFILLLISHQNYHSLSHGRLAGASSSRRTSARQLTARRAEPHLH